MHMPVPALRRAQCTGVDADTASVEEAELQHYPHAPASCGYNSMLSKAEEAAEVVRKASYSCINNTEFAKCRTTSLFSHSVVLKPQFTLKLVQYSHLLCFELIGRAMISAHDAHTLQ